MSFNRLLFIPSLFVFTIGANANYWQQKVIYDIDVTLVDTLHQINGHEYIQYVNNSPDSLAFIWFHLWPNAYKNNETALARQKFNSFSTKMYFAPDSSFGWIEIDHVVSDGSPVTWSYRSADTTDVALFNLDRPLAPGDTLVLDLDFKVQIPNVLSRLGHLGQHYELTQWFPKPAVYDMKGWHPMSYLDRGEFYSEWGDFTVHITLPENYRVAATGVLQDSSEIVWRAELAAFGNALLDSIKHDKKHIPDTLKALKDKKPASSNVFKTITFKQDNVHDFAWFADKRFIVTNDQYKHPDGKLTELWSFVLPRNLKNYRYSNDYIKDAVKYFSDWFMEYPYEHATVVDGDFSAGGGMEYPMITLINNSGFQPGLEQVIIHEVGHNWFYGLSASNERDYPWMDEGLNSYAENRYWKTKYDDDSMLAHSYDKPPFWTKIVESFVKDLSKTATEELMYYFRALPERDQPPNLSSEEYSSINYGMMVYKKAALATASLEAYLGTALMDSIWHVYFDRWAFRHPQPDDLRQVFEEVSGKDLGWYFDDMIGSTEKIDYALDSYDTAQRGDDYTTTVRIKNNGDFSPPLPVGLYGDSPEANTVQWVHPLDGKNTYTFTTDFNVKDVRLDPEMVLLDIDRTNNHTNLNLNFDPLKFSLNRQGDYNVTVLPYPWYSSIDYVLPNVALSHFNLIPGGTNWLLRAYYGFRTQRFGLSGLISHHYYKTIADEFVIKGRFDNAWAYQVGEFGGKLKWLDETHSRDATELSVILYASNITDGLFVSGNNNSDTSGYFDTSIWESDRFIKSSLHWERKIHRVIWNTVYSFGFQVGAREKGHPFASMSAKLYYRKKLTPKESLHFTLFSGHAWGDLPTQERFYISTDIDANLNKLYIFSHNDGLFAPGHGLTFESEFTIPGYLYADSTGSLPSTNSFHGFRILTDIPKISSLDIVLTGAVAWNDIDDSFEGLGTVAPIYNLGPLKLIYTPLVLDNASLSFDASRFQVMLDFTSSSIRLGS